MVVLVKKILKRLGKVSLAWFHYKYLKKNKGVSQKNQNKNFVEKWITKYFGGSDPMSELHSLFWAEKNQSDIIMQLFSEDMFKT